MICCPPKRDYKGLEKNKNRLTCLEIPYFTGLSEVFHTQLTRNHTQLTPIYTQLTRIHTQLTQNHTQLTQPIHAFEANQNSMPPEVKESLLIYPCDI